MSRSKIVIADTDEKFLLPLELKFLSELNDEVDLEIITDPAYFQLYFSQPKNIDVLMTSEDFYTPELRNHNIGTTVVMLEKKARAEFDGRGIYTINKYSSINDLYNFIFAIDDNISKENTPKETKVVLVSSASGGTGKTTIAMGLCESLNNRYKKVLYIDAENMNSFQYWMKSNTTIPVTTGVAIGAGGDEAYDSVKSLICKEGFEYLPSFATSLMSMNVDLSIYEKIIEGAKLENQYDVIVVDTDASFNFEKLSLIAKADKVFMVTTQSKASAYCLGQFTKNVSCNNDDKFVFICNDYKENEYDSFSEPSIKHSYEISEYVDHIDNIDRMDIHKLGEETDINKLSFLVI